MSLPVQYWSPIDFCTLCVDHLQHCHGTAIVIDEETHVCSDGPDCTLSIDEHWFVSLEDIID